MNNSKKLKTKKVKKDRLIEQKPITKISKPWIITSLVLVLILVGALLFDQLYKRVYLTIDGKEYTFQDLSYYFYIMEAQFGSYDMTASYDGTSDFTVGDYVKQRVFDLATYNEVLYKEAVEEGYALTEEEKETVQTNVDLLFEQSLSKAVIKKNKFTKEYISDIMSKSTLIERYRQDKIDEMGIDKEAIRAGINFEDYRQYDFEYLFISTKTTDDKGNTVAMDEAQKKVAYEKINAYYEKAKTTEDWSTLLPEAEKEVRYSTSNFIESDNFYSEDFEAIIMALENGDVSEIYPDEAGYYIVRMVDNNSDERYESQVESAISDKESELFNTVLSKILSEHDVNTNNKAIKRLQVGSLTLAY